MATKTYRSIYISKEKDDALREASLAEGISISRLTGRALDFYLNVDLSTRKRIEEGIAPIGSMTCGGKNHGSETTKKQAEFYVEI